MTLEVVAVPGIPQVGAGDDLGRLITDAVGAAGLSLQPGDVLVVASKIIAKAQDLRRYASRDSVIDAETVRVVAERRVGERITRVVESAAGPVMAAAGVDESNTGPAGGVLVLPREPDAAAAAVLASVRAAAGWAPTLPLGVVVSDTAGRPWRSGVVDFALGSAGLQVLQDHRGHVDADGRPLSVTVIAVSDEIAAAADLVKGKADASPVAIVRGLPWASPDSTLPGASSIVRTGPGDWFRTGPVEAVRAALGIEPGSPESVSVGIPSLEHEPVTVRAGRVLALSLHSLPAVNGTVSSTDEGCTLRLLSRDDYLLGQGVARVRVAAASEGLRVSSELRAATGVEVFLVDS